MSSINIAELNPALEADAESVRTWVYPTNYPVRQYQVDIVHQALFRNTLVSLPTGLGKTLIAAVVMYNYFRWFPQGKIVFMAPTKPLVAQQVTACYGIMGIPEECTAELQGSIAPARRQMLWQQRRVFYCTPQSLANDIKTGACNPSSFVLVVVDEAHRATGNYAFTTVVREIARFTDCFRVLALSATPGVDKPSIQKVISNLRINHIEARSEEDPDVQPYVFDKQVEIVKCKMGSHIERIKRDLLEITRLFMFNLLRRNILTTRDPDKLHQFQLIQLQSELKVMFQNCRLTKPEYGELEGEVGLLVSLAHAKKLLVANGAGALRQFLVSLQEEAKESGAGSKAKAILLKNNRYLSLLQFLNRTVEDEERMSTRHPKITKLKEILADHFERHAQMSSSTKCIIFTQFRDSVQEIITELEDVVTVSARPFVGQGNGRSSSSSSLKGQKQHEQVAVLEEFNRGDFNVLVATCIGEEGLDIAEVDMIISFDALSSPTRMVQRMGRTGRKRAGRVIMLATEGVEEHKLVKSHSSAMHIIKLLREGWRQFRMFQLNPRMIPDDVTPTVDMRCLEIEDCQLSQIGGRKQPSSRGSRKKSGDSDTKENKPTDDLEDVVGGAKVGGNAKKPVLTRKKQRVEQEKPLRRIDNFLNEIECTPDGAPASRAAELDGVFNWIDTPDDLQPTTPNIVLATQAAPAELQAEYWICGCGSKYRSNRKTCRVCTPPAQEHVPIIDNTPASATHDTPTDLQLPTATTIQQSCTPLDLHAVFNCPEYDELLAAIGVAKRWQFQPSATADRSPKKFAVFEDYSLPPRSNTNVSLVTPSVAKRFGWQVPAKREAVATVVAVSRSPVPMQLEQTPPTTAVVAAATMGFVFVEGKQKPSQGSSPNAPMFELPAFDSDESDTELPAVAPMAVGGPSFAGFDVSSDEDSVAEQELPHADDRQRETTLPEEPVDAAPTLYGWEDYDDPDLIAEFANPQPRTLLPTPVMATAPKATLPAAPSVSLTPFLGPAVDSQACNVWTYNTPSTMPDTTTVGAAATPQRAPHPVNENQPCEVCGDANADAGNPIVFCDGVCGTAVHLSCYGLTIVPEGDFFCEGCEMHRTRKVKPYCILCDSNKGLMKRTTCNTWTHLTCTLWTPELTVDNNIRTNNLEALDPDRARLMCAICSGHGGACVQCAAPNCLTAMHPQCARSAGRPLTINENCDGELEYDLYCFRHEHYAKSRPSYQALAGSPHESQSSCDLEFQSPPARPSYRASPARVQVTEAEQVPKRKRHRPINRAKSPPPPTPPPPTPPPRSSAVTAHPTPSSTRGVKTPASGGMLSLTQLMEQNSDKKSTPTGEAGRRKLLRRGKNPRNPQPANKQHATKRKAPNSSVAAKFFAEEAELSGSASDDEDDDEDEEEITESQRLFINDAPTPNGRGSISDQEMYLQVNRDLMDSPDVPVFGFRGGDRGLYYCSRAMRQHELNATPDPTPSLSDEASVYTNGSQGGGLSSVDCAAPRPGQSAQEPWSRVTGKPNWKDIDKPSKASRVLKDISNVGPSFDWVLSDSDG